MTDSAIDQQIADFLRACKTASLATVGAEGSPCNANIQYASDEAWRLVWVSSDSAAHSQNLAANPQAAVTIYAHQDSPEMIHGLQMRGGVEELSGKVLEDAQAIYTAKYPFVAEPPFRAAVLRQRFYRFTPAWLRWIDNRRGFGWKFEKKLQ